MVSSLTTKDVGAKAGDDTDEEKEAPSTIIQFAESSTNTTRSEVRVSSFVREEKDGCRQVFVDFTPRNV